MYDTATEPGGVLLTACGNRRESVCPACSAGVQARRPPARPRRADRRQGHPRDRRRASVRVRHLHRPLVRPGPRPPPARQDRPALPPPPRPQGAALPARPRHLLPAPPRATTTPGSAGRCARTATTTPPPCCSTPTPGTCGAGLSPTCPATSPAWPGSPSKQLRDAGSRPVRQGRRIPGPRRRPLPRRHPPRRPRRLPTSRHPPGSPPTCCADAIGQAAAAAVHRHRPPRTARRCVLRFGDQIDPRPIRHGDALPGTGASCPSRRSATTSPSTPPRPSTPPASPTGRCRSRPTSTTCAAPATTGR